MLKEKINSAMLPGLILVKQFIKPAYRQACKKMLLIDLRYHNVVGSVG
jgi:hypothetical protein